jgi:hypothetical protein
MTTLAQMVDDVLADMSTYVRTQESITVLTSGIDADDLTLAVDDATALTKGLLEVGDELVYVKTVSPTTGAVALLPGTRGFKGTTAATHATNTLVRATPTFPRSKVVRNINDTIRSIDLYQVKKYDFTFDGSTFMYDMPVGCEDVVGVTTETLDSSGRWHPVRHYRLDHNHWPTGATEARVGLELREAPIPGRIVRVQYLARGAELVSGDEFSDSGLPTSSEDVVRLGAMWRLLMTIDPGKATAMAPSADAQDAAVPVGRATDVSKYVYQLFSARLAEEKAKQADSFFLSINYQG